MNMRSRVSPWVPGLTGLVAGLAISLAVVGTFAYATWFPSKTDPTRVAESFGVTVKVVDHLECSAADAIGCYSPVDPNTVYILAGLEPDVERYAVLHELGHVLQERAGVPRDECGAEAIARALGATYSSYDC